MKLITKHSDYAVRALCFIAKHRERIVSVSELVKRLRIPRPFLRKILQILTKKRLLKSYKGRGGGFELVLSPDKIFLLDIIGIFQGPLKINECLFKKAPCPNMISCKIKKKMDNIERFVVSEFKDITLATLL